MAHTTLLTAAGIQSVEHEILTMMTRVDPYMETAGSERVMFEARQDFRTFMELMYPGYVDGEHLELLRDALVRVKNGETKRLIITMPPRHSKSMHVSEGFPAWYLGHFPDNRVMAVSHTQMLANKFSYRVRQKFKDMNWPFKLVRISDDRGGVEQWDIEGSATGGYMAVGVGGSPTGMGADLIIIDDPVRNQQEADSALIRERLWDWYSGTLYTRRQPGAAIIVTMTRWHEDDLTGRLLQKMRDGGEHWEELHLPAELPDGRYLWSEFWSDIEYEKAKMGSDRVWLAQYMGRPSHEGGNLLKEEWFPAVTPGEMYVGMVQAWDCAEKPGVTNDYSVCATIGISTTGYDLLHLWRDRVEFPDLLQAAQDQATWVQSIYPNIPYTLAIEDKSAGTQLIQTLRATSRLPVIAVASTEKDAKVQRVIRNTAVAKARRLRVMQSASWRSDFFREIKGFPNEAHDDIVDAVMIALDSATGQDMLVASTKDYMHRDETNDRQPTRRRYQPPVSPP